MKKIFRRPIVLATAVTVAATAAVAATPALRAESSPDEPAGCLPVPRAECGTLRVPLVRAHPEQGSTSVAYAVIRRRNTSRPAAGTIAVNPGGPGDSAFAQAAMYVQKFGGLLDNSDLLLIDPRGVNRSDPANCGITSLPATRDAFVRMIGDCGKTLGPRARGYTSAEIADDMDAIRAKLGIGRLDLLGQSYGTYLMTVYAQRHPARVRSMVLSSAYPLAFDMWARPGARAARRAIQLMCERSAGACDGRQVLRDISRLAQRLGKQPISYTVEGENRRLDDTSLAIIVHDLATSPSKGLGEIPAMVRAALRGDTGRLIEAARRLSPMSGSTAREEQPFNPNQAAPVMCNDYPRLWDRKASVGTRLRQFSAKRAALPEKAFWPFGKRAWTSVSSANGNACIRWPDQNGPVQPTGGPFPDVPVLVVSGDLDPNTATEEGRLAARQFRRAAVVEVPNVGHIPEKEPSGCVAGIESGFIRNLRIGDTSCLSAIPPLPVRSTGAR
ncbi:alpha/beta fold hydrolase [Actinomadura fulvescens]|uniref:Alpha/beta hydrolase n=1 Tax=Actinomadura fulvescens TaxID=46160 RepID=A0ABP6CBM3_9ACTN